MCMEQSVTIVQDTIRDRSNNTTVAAITALITRGVGGLYAAVTMDGSLLYCRARGKFRLDGITPLPGDVVTLFPVDQAAAEITEDAELSAEDTEERPAKKAKKASSDDIEAAYVIREIEPRQNTLIRPPMANLTHLFVILPCAEPAPDLLMADKLTAIAVHSGIRPILVVNKADIAPEKGTELADIYEKAGFPVFLVSAASGLGIEQLEDYLATEAAQGQLQGRPMRAAFAGVSAAGKSTLMTRLYPHLALKTNTVSRKIERGRHTTRHVELYPVQANGSTYYLADTPGFSMLDFTHFNLLPLAELPECFPEFVDRLGQCRYTKCTHTKEEGCAVLSKLQDGLIAPSRHENFVAIAEEIRRKPEWQREKEGDRSQSNNNHQHNHRRKR